MDTQTQAIVVGNNIFGAVRQLKELLQTINDLNNTYVQMNLANVFGAMPTAALQADGSLGTADTAPVSGNPIDNRKMTSLELALPAYDIGVMMTLLQQAAALLNGSTVAQQSAAPSMLAKVTNE